MLHIPHLYIVKLGFTVLYFFLNFDPKHRLWEHLRIASVRRLKRESQSIFWSKTKKKCVVFTRVRLILLNKCGVSWGIFYKDMLSWWPFYFLLLYFN